MKKDRKKSQERKLLMMYHKRVPRLEPTEKRKLIENYINAPVSLSINRKKNFNALRWL